MSRRPRRPAPVAGFLPRRQGRWLLATAVCWLAIGHLGSAQDAAPAAEKPSRRDASSPRRARGRGAGRLRHGLQGEGGGFRNLAGTITVPADWPNQQRVRVVKEDLPPGAAVSYASIDDVGRQMTVKIPFLPAGKEVRAVVTFAVETLTPPPLPQDTAEYTAAARHNLGRKLAVHLAPSPKIESDDAQVRHAMAEAVGDRSGSMGEGRGHPPLGPQDDHVCRRHGKRAILHDHAENSPRRLHGDELPERGHAQGGRISGEGWCASPATATTKSTWSTARARGTGSAATPRRTPRSGPARRPRA